MSSRALPRVGVISVSGLALFTAAVLSVQLWPLRFEPPVEQTAVSVPAEIRPPVRGLPFTFPEVVRYFESSLGHLPQERSSSYATFVGGQPEEHAYTIKIAQIGSEIAVRFIVIDNYGMNIVREFFEAPFFRWSESEQFYMLLYLEDGTRSLQLPRFNVLFQYRTEPDAMSVGMLFSPLLQREPFGSDPVPGREKD